MNALASVLGCAVVLASTNPSPASLGVIFSEDFESYPNTAAMSAVWQGFDGVLATQIDDDLDGIPEVTGKFAYHPGGSVNTYDLASPISASPTEWIRLSVDIYDNDTSLNPFFPLNPGNKRMSFGMRNSTQIGNILELGFFNSQPYMHLAYRAILFDSLNGTPNPNWSGWDLGTELVGNEELPVNRFRGAAWYRYSVTIKPESLVFEIDLDLDGIAEASNEHFDIAHTFAPGFDQLRFGSPSGITSAGGGAHFDNIRLEVIPAPEPTSLSLMTIATLSLLKRRNV